jgi:S-ribosylhomocysteine lyase
MKDILKVKKKKDIPELNVYQCGTYKMHSLKQAKKVAKYVLKKGIGVMNNEELELDEELLLDL